MRPKLTYVAETSNTKQLLRSAEMRVLDHFKRPNKERCNVIDVAR
jgi:hypothetical protein